MSATIDGVAWTAVFVDASVYSSGDGLFFAGLTGSGIGNRVSVALSLSRVTGLQVFAFPQRGGQIMIGLNTWHTFFGGSGTATVDTLTAHRITGTFQFNAATRDSVSPIMRQATGRFAVNF